MKAMRLFGALILLAAGSMAEAGSLDFYYQRHLENLRSFRADDSGILAKSYSQLVDHARPELGRFAQRYYVDETYSDSSRSPVFFYICGEASCKPGALAGEIREMARKYHAKLVALEHRYYGVSLPRPSLSTTDLKYLGTDAALQDLAAFQKFMMTTNNWSGKWITFGGSYPGSLSAYYRLKYPELTAGSLASSAPVMAKENFEEYDAHVTQVAGPQCANQMRVAYRAIEAALPDQQRMTSIKRSFGVESLKNDTDFLFMIADIGSAAVQYGYQQKFCDMLNNSGHPLQGYAEFAQYLYQAWDISDPLSLAIEGAESENPADYADGLGMRQWYYQSCTEYGYWQNAHSDPAKSTRSDMINAAYFRDVCSRLFGLTDAANIDYINREFYQPLSSHSTSHILFTNGSTDPWSLLSMSATNGNAKNKNLHYYTIDGAAHCDDLRASRLNDSAELQQARNLLSSLMYDWLATDKK
jgi:pimeloyl-ACP methyl ester carboxylesterase